MFVRNAYIWAFFCAYLCAFVRKWSYTWEQNASICDKKTHVYREAEMIASIRGKQPHVYRVIILKQMADHSKKVVFCHRQPKLCGSSLDFEFIPENA